MLARKQRNFIIAGFRAVRRILRISLKDIINVNFCSKLFFASIWFFVLVIIQIGFSLNTLKDRTSKLEVMDTYGILADNYILLLWLEAYFTSRKNIIAFRDSCDRKYSTCIRYLLAATMTIPGDSHTLNDIISLIFYLALYCYYTLLLN